MCVCSLRYPACNTHAPHYHLWPAGPYTIYTQYLINGKFFDTKFCSTVIVYSGFEILTFVRPCIIRATMKATNKMQQIPFIDHFIDLFESAFFIDIKSFRSHYGPGVESASNTNEYQEYFRQVKAAGA